MEKSLAGADTYGCSTGHLLSNYVLVRYYPRHRVKCLISFRSRSLRNHLLVRHYPDTEWCFIFRNVLLAVVTNLRGPFDRAVIKIVMKIEYAEGPLSSASLIVHPVDSQFVKEHIIHVCLLSAVNFDIQGVLMTHGLGCCYFLLICWLVVLFMITCFISEHEMLVVVLRSVSKIYLLLCYQTK
ncbi:hypothetical protein R3W88_006950 [Solanum pinnatisectum]|uniref:Uncharacterized protein n=1 Tax=Solanum pinnatisectum TaxID=50273 RepID=A0AAV9KK64_9SOLN|nr:hypothetical protein R3W88_006950 [Solanum pinnatisectum]